MTWPICSSTACASRPSGSRTWPGRCPSATRTTTRASRTDMDEDWRIRVTVQGDWSHDRLEARTVADDVSAAMGDRVAGSRDGDELFLYAPTEEAARAAEEVVRADLADHGSHGTVELTRWHDDAGEWKPADVPLPATDAERAAEHASMVAQEDAASAADSAAAWEIRVDLPSRGDARRLAARLEAEGVEPVRRWKYLFVGATDEDAARAWADELRATLPAGSTVTVEATFASVERNNPFAVFGAAGGV